MYAFPICLLLVAFQVSCDGAPERLTPEPTPHADVSQEKPADVSQEIPADVSQEIPADVSEAKPASVSQEKPPDVSQDTHLEKRAGK